MPKSICCVVGTRPEVIKMAPVILKLREAGCYDKVIVLGTAQHRQLLDQALAVFGIELDFDLDVMTPNQSLTTLTSKLISQVGAFMAEHRPDLVLVQGDTTTVFATCLACFYLRIPIGHVEAGLRTFDLSYPFPEEFNRISASLVSTLHFAPTASAADNLYKEGVARSKVIVSGNTVVDALLMTVAKNPALAIQIPDEAQVILLTAHRRENFGLPMAAIFRAVIELTDRFPDLYFVYPVHPNPNVRLMAEEMLAPCTRVIRTEPLDYVGLVAVLQRCKVVLTDSGGLQEEAPALSKPVLVLRNETERPEAVTAGVAKLVGPDHTRIVHEVSELLTSSAAYDRMAEGGSPYGDGLAAGRICSFIASYFAEEAAAAWAEFAAVS